MDVSENVMLIMFITSFLFVNYLFFIYFVPADFELVRLIGSRYFENMFYKSFDMYLVETVCCFM